MKQLIKKLLMETNFENIQSIENIADYNSIFSENKDRTMFYVVSFYDSINEFNEQFEESQNEAFNYICSKENQNELKKNTSMILFIKLKDLDEKDKMQSQILELEEDVYFFKKYVVLYLEKELEEFKSAIEGRSITEFMKANINKEDLFEDFKREETISFYSLILKLYIKLPHLAYSDTFETENIMDLNKRIEFELKLKTIFDLHNELLEIDEDDIDSWIDELINIQ
ncbi:hypothetical protein C4097_18205 [Clostridioides difficile]|nr:hypothetical protein [Clostridioides difficile]